MFKRGDVVYLKSGSPPMTVSNVDDHGGVRLYMYEAKEPMMFPRFAFHEDMLTATRPVQVSHPLTEGTQER